MTNYLSTVCSTGVANSLKVASSKQILSMWWVLHLLNSHTFLPSLHNISAKLNKLAKRLWSTFCNGRRFAYHTIMKFVITWSLFLNPWMNRLVHVMSIGAWYWRNCVASFQLTSKEVYNNICAVLKFVQFDSWLGKLFVLIQNHGQKLNYRVHLHTVVTSVHVYHDNCGGLYWKIRLFAAVGSQSESCFSALTSLHLLYLYLYVSSSNITHV